MTPLLSEPWAITESAFQVIVAIATRDEFFADVREKALQAKEGQALKNTHTVAVRDGVAIIPISGPLFRHADLFTAISGATSYATLRKDLESAIENPSVRAIIFNIDSPGGEVHGTGELSSAIFAARGKKPMTAYVGGSMALAAYWIGSAADQIVVDPSAMVGSIGVRTLLVDSSKKNELAGVKEYDIVSSQSPLKVANPSEEGDRARVQLVVTAMAAVFITDVARNRGVSADKVLKSYGRGDVFIGQDAVDAGLADRVGNFESVLAELSARRLTNRKGAVAMDYTQEECEECMEEQAQAKAALGFDLKASGKEFGARVTALARFERQVLEAVSGANAAEALVKVVCGAEAFRDLPQVRSELAKVRSEGIRRDLRATLESGLDKSRLSLGAIQRAIPLMLRGEQKIAWQSAMSELDEVTRESVLNAACSVPISADDLQSIGEYTKTSASIAAEPFKEPKRDTVAESEELDETAMEVKKAADKARATFARAAAAQPK